MYDLYLYLFILYSGHSIWEYPMPSYLPRDYSEHSADARIFFSDGKVASLSLSGVKPRIVGKIPPPPPGFAVLPLAGL